MEGLYPIIRRKRRPLVSVGDAVAKATIVGKMDLPAGRQQHVEPVVEKVTGARPETTRETRVLPSKHDEEASTTRQSRPTVVG